MREVKCSNKSCSNECKRRKIKCNGQTPCQRCGNLSLECMYAPNCCNNFKESEYVMLAQYFKTQAESCVVSSSRCRPRYHPSKSKSTSSSQTSILLRAKSRSKAQDRSVHPSTCQIILEPCQSVRHPWPLPRLRASEQSPSPSTRDFTVLLRAHSISGLQSQV